MCEVLEAINMLLTIIILQKDVEDLDPDVDAGANGNN